jgi:hypothetical protein
MKLYKRIIALFSAVSILVVCSLPAFAEYTGKTPSKLLDLWNTATYDVIQGTTGLGGLYNDYVNWCWRGTSGATPRYGSGAGRVPSSVTSSGCKTDTVYNSTDVTNKYTVVNTTNNTWYNPVTNNYNTYNNITYNSTYNTYKITNNTYNTYVTNNYTYVTYCIVNPETQSTWYYEIYYQLPDGRNSYDLKAEDVWGLGLSYDAVNYQMVTEDDGTLGLWHFDGNLNDASVHGSNATFTGAATYSFVDSGFASALSLSGSPYTLNFPISESPKQWTVEGRLRVSCSDYKPLYSNGWNSGWQNNTFFTSSDSAGDKKNDMLAWIKKKIPTDIKSYISDDECSQVVSDIYSYKVANSSKDFVLKKFSIPCSGLFGITESYTLSVSVKYHENYAGMPDGSMAMRYWYDAVITLSQPSVSVCGHVIDDSYNTYAYVCDGTKTTIFCNGVAVAVGDAATLSPFSITNGDSSYSIDELRVTNRALYTENYTPSAQPFDTNKVLALPDSGVENQIAVKSTTPIGGMRVGGVRPTYPSDGYLYVYCDSNNIVQDVQQYQTDGWYSVDACIYKNGKWVTLKGRDLTDITITKPDEPTPTPTPGGGSSSGGSGGSSDSGGSNWFLDLLSDLLSVVKDVLKGILKSIVGLVFGLFKWILKFMLFLNANYLGGLVPAPVWSLLCLVVPLPFVFGIVLLVRGVFRR